MDIIPLSDIKQRVSETAAIAAVKQGFIAYGKGEVTLPTPMQILFHNDTNDLLADCHIKAAQSRNAPYFVIKLASGFYDNAALGLPVNNGFVMLMSATTGQPVALLQDGGWLTEIRTAAAGALAAGLCPVTPDMTLGIIGTGTQAKRQAEMVCRHLGLSSVVVFGRSADKATALCQALSDSGLSATVADSVKSLCHTATIVTTTTPSTTPIITADDLPNVDNRRLHIVAVGSDSPGKVETAPEVMAQATHIITDDHHQCLEEGDFGAAVRAGAVAENADISLCELLAQPIPTLSGNGVSVVDLTGLGVQDLAVASLVVSL